MARSVVRPTVNTGRVGRPGGRTKMLVDWAIETSKAFQRQQIQKDRVASGRSLESWEVDIRDIKHVDLKAANYLGTIIQEKVPMGRQPTSAGGTGAVFKAILRWIPQKGLRANPGQTLLQLAYAITRNIHMFGTTLFRDPNPSRAVSLEEAISEGFRNVNMDIIALQIAEEASDKLVANLTLNNKNIKVKK